MILLKIVILFQCLIGLIGEPVPLVLWGEETPKMPAMYIMQPYELQEIIFSLLDKHTILLFVENNLTTKDFLCKNPETNTNCFSYMSTMDNLNYYTQVQNPVEIMEAIIKEPPIKWLNFDRAIDCHVGQVYGFEFSDLYGSRVEQLIAHDTMIAEATWKIDCPLVFIYTTRTKPKPHRRPLSLYELYRTKEEAKTQLAEDTSDKARHRGRHRGRHRKAYQPDPLNAEHLLITENFALRYQSIHFLRNEPHSFTRTFYGTQHRKARSPTESELREPVTLSGMKVDQIENSGFTVRFDSTPVLITLDILTIPNYDGVRFRTITANGVKYGMMPINLPDNLSYCCGVLEAYGSDKSMLTFHNVQFQAWRSGSNNSEDFEFDEPLFCSGALTPHIMEGLVIGFLFVFIVGCGLLWIIDIGSNAHMDDPLGPDLQLKAHE